jgi:hypothetical protein
MSPEQTINRINQAVVELDNARLKEAKKPLSSVKKAHSKRMGTKKKVQSSFNSTVYQVIYREKYKDASAFKTTKTLVESINVSTGLDLEVVKTSSPKMVEVRRVS